jgi:hypothetical protein
MGIRPTPLPIQSPFSLSHHNLQQGPCSPAARTTTAVPRWRAVGPPRMAQPHETVSIRFAGWRSVHRADRADPSSTAAAAPSIACGGEWLCSSCSTCNRAQALRCAHPCCQLLRSITGVTLGQRTRPRGVSFDAVRLLLRDGAATADPLRGAGPIARKRQPPPSVSQANRRRRRLSAQDDEVTARASERATAEPLRLVARPTTGQSRHSLERTALSDANRGECERLGKTSSASDTCGIVALGDEPAHRRQARTSVPDLDHDSDSHETHLDSDCDSRSQHSSDAEVSLAPKFAYKRWLKARAHEHPEPEHSCRVELPAQIQLPPEINLAQPAPEAGPATTGRPRGRTRESLRWLIQAARARATDEASW